jgi:hypothetical protein
LDDKKNSVEDAEEEGRRGARKVSVPLGSRVELMERDVRGHSRSIGVLTHILGEHGKLLDEVEEWRMKALLDEVRREEQSKALTLKLDQMSVSFSEGLKSVNVQVEAMRSTWTRILWTIGSPVAIAVIIAVLGLTFGVKPPTT